MSVTILTAKGNLICDDLDKGEVEYSIAVTDEGPDTGKRGKLWGNKDAIGDAMRASEIKLTSPENDEPFRIEVEELDRDGNALFTVLAVPA